MWLSKNGMSKLGKFFYNKKNFDLVLTIIGVIFTLISIWLFIVFIQYMINPPCDTSSGICSL